MGPARSELYIFRLSSQNLIFWTQLFHCEQSCSAVETCHCRWAQRTATCCSQQKRLRSSSRQLPDQPKLLLGKGRGRGIGRTAEMFSGQGYSPRSRRGYSWSLESSLRGSRPIMGRSSSWSGRAGYWYSSLVFLSSFLSTRNSSTWTASVLMKGRGSTSTSTFPSLSFPSPYASALPSRSIFPFPAAAFPFPLLFSPVSAGERMYLSTFSSRFLSSARYLFDNS